MREVNPKDTKRALAFELWMKSPMPMVTIFKTLNVGKLVRYSRKNGLKINMLMCWCIGRAATSIPEFYMLPIKGRLMQFDNIAINVVVRTNDGGINTCDVPFSDNLQQFNADYLRLIQQVHNTNKAYAAGDDYAIVGTSALTEYEIDGAVNQYSGIFNNPFLVWGKFRRGLFKTIVPISFQFHHTQMDGTDAAKYLDLLQTEINTLK